MRQSSYWYNYRTSKVDINISDDFKQNITKFDSRLPARLIQNACEFLKYNREINFALHSKQFETKGRQNIREEWIENDKWMNSQQ